MRSDAEVRYFGKRVAEYLKWAEQALIALNEYVEGEPIYGLKFALENLGNAALNLNYPVPVEIDTIEHGVRADGIREITGKYEVRFPDESDGVWGNCAQRTGEQALIEFARTAAIVAIKQWRALVESDWDEYRHGTKQVFDGFLYKVPDDDGFGRTEAQPPEPGAVADAEKAKQSKGGAPPVDPYANLRAFARDVLKGQERAVIEALCDAQGELRIADLAVKAGIGWDDPFEGFKNAQGRLAPKLRKVDWILRRVNNSAKLSAIKG
jgi:hypothetical protein